MAGAVTQETTDALFAERGGGSNSYALSGRCGPGSHVVTQYPAKFVVHLAFGSDSGQRARGMLCNIGQRDPRIPRTQRLTADFKGADNCFRQRYDRRRQKLDKRMTGRTPSPISQAVPL